MLIVADPGIQTDPYTLLFSRVAPVQIVMWGAELSHTLTLGLPDSVDYYVVADGAGAADSDLLVHLHEQVVLSSSFA